MKFLVWTPSYEGNREKPKSEQITMQLCPLTYGEISSANKRIVKTPVESTILYITSTKPDGTVVKTPLPENVEYEDNQDEILLETICKHVGTIVNLKDVYGDPISTGKELVDIRCDVGLIREVETGLINASILKAGLEKNLLPPSDGVQGKDQDGGTAKAAKPKG